MDKESARKLIIKTLKEKSVMKQDVFQTTDDVFKEFKSTLRKIADDLKKEAETLDKRIVIEYKEKGEFEAELKFAGDILIFYLHTNIFNFDLSHGIYNSSYVQQDNFRSYCGMITIYNFLADSFKYDRVNDIGYMIARIFINKEKHYFIEGKRQLGFLYNNFSDAVVDTKAILSIIESAILYTLDFDLLTPPYNDVKEVTVNEILEATKYMVTSTGKRMGYTFQADHDKIE
ncbi:MAG: hypothetical protein ABII90_15865 [Bacteroidota bacterium]